jgi:peptidoglycan/LPS O-acetylase OafA/YrhL
MKGTSGAWRAVADKGFAPSDRGEERVPALDGVRGLAALSVVAWHYVALPLTGSTGSMAGWSGVLAKALKLSAGGVQLFFVLSGFLIGGILLDHRQAPHFFRGFYVRRAMRILPLYLLWLAIFYALADLAPTLVGRDGSLAWLFGERLPAWSYLTFSQNLVMAARDHMGPEWLAITWSLAVEEQFYLLLPVLVRWLDGRARAALLVTLVLIAPLARRFATGYDTALLPMHADSLLLGVLLAMALRNTTAREMLLRRRAALEKTLGLLVVGLALYCVSDRTAVGAPYVWSAVAAASALVVWLAVTDATGPVTRLLSTRFLREAGVLAYGIYLMHQGFNGLVHGLWLGRSPSLGSVRGVAATLLAFAGTILVARASWAFFERPLVAWGRRIPYGEAAPSFAKHPDLGQDAVEAVDSAHGRKGHDGFRAEPSPADPRTHTQGSRRAPPGHERRVARARREPGDLERPRRRRPPDALR